jgi:RNA polymerase sigma-70 factor (ECF subfamily)
MAVAATYGERVRPAPASPTDADLVAAFKKGDVRAFDALFARYRQPIFGYIYRSVGAAAVAEELTQDVFLKAFLYLRRMDASVSFRAWIYRVATTTCIDAHRATTRRPALVNDAEALMAAQAPVRMDPAEWHLDHERRRDVRSALGALPAQYRQALVLRQLQDLSYAEIADALGISVEAVTSLIHRARHAFRAAYAQQKGEE